MTPDTPRRPGTPGQLPGSLEIPRVEDLRTPNPLARLAAERWRLRRQGAGREDLARLGEQYRGAVEQRAADEEKT